MAKRNVAHFSVASQLESDDMIAVLVRGEDRKSGARTADTPHTTRGRALACGAVWEWEEEAPRCPRASRTPARPWDAPYTLQIAHKKKERKVLMRAQTYSAPPKTLSKCTVLHWSVKDKGGGGREKRKRSVFGTPSLSRLGYWRERRWAR